MLHKEWIRPWVTAVANKSSLGPDSSNVADIQNSWEHYNNLLHPPLYRPERSCQISWLVVATSYAGSAYPVIWPEWIRALDGTVAAGIGIGITNAMAQFGGIVGPQVYSTVFGPTHHVSYIICLCFLIVAIAAILGSWWLVWRKDQKKDATLDSY